MPKKNLKDFIVFRESTFSTALKLLNISGNKCLCVLNQDRQIIGTISDGDIRRSLLRGIKLNDKIKKSYNHNPTLFEEGKFNPSNYLKVFVRDKLDILPIVDKDKKLLKIITREDIFNFSHHNYNNTSVIIMAGGRGKRLMPLTSKLPKPLLSINGEVMLIRLIKKFIRQNFINFYISVNYKKELVKKYLKNEFKDQNEINVNYIYEKIPLGTIGALSEIVPDKLSDPFLVTNSDTLINNEYTNIIDYHKANNFDLTVVISKKSIMMPFGNIIYKNNKILKIEEKPNLEFNLNVGFYIISKKCLPYIRKNIKSDADKFINKLIKNKFNIGIYEINFEDWSEIGRKKDYDEFNKLVLID